jgi:hypothetical protein
MAPVVPKPVAWTLAMLSAADGRREDGGRAGGTEVDIFVLLSLYKSILYENKYRYIY